jgi:hypothetical protein
MQTPNAAVTTAATAVAQANKLPSNITGPNGVAIGQRSFGTTSRGGGAVGQSSAQQRIPFTTTPGQLGTGGGGGRTGGFNKRAGFGSSFGGGHRRQGGGGGSGTPQQMFYCDVCKISCAGPQTYKVCCVDLRLIDAQLKIDSIFIFTNFLRHKKKFNKKIVFFSVLVFSRFFV